MKKAFLVIALFASGVPFAQAGGNPHIQNLLEVFASNCGISSPDFRKGTPAFARKNYAGKWQIITRGELEKCWECFDSAFVSSGNDGRHVVQIASTSETGDWSQFVLYCYGQDGKLSVALSDFNSVLGWAIVSRFSMKQGKVVEAPREFRDLKTWEVLAEKPDGAEQIYTSDKPALYSNLQDLPFYSLLKVKR